MRGIVLEAFGVGNMPDNPDAGWLPWLKDQRRKGLMIYLASQCRAGPLHPELYRSGSIAVDMGLVESGMSQMTPEARRCRMDGLDEWSGSPTLPASGDQRQDGLNRAPCRPWPCACVLLLTPGVLVSRRRW